jgi:hypothetical protein
LIDDGIRGGEPINELKNVAERTLGHHGQNVCLYRKAVTWEQALNSSVTDERLTWGNLPVPPVAVPGQTELT